MSVAFRRESDEEHLEPKFEIPIPPGPNLVTARGLRLTREKVEALEAVVTADMAEDDVKKLRRELRYWRTRLATAQVQPVPNEEVVTFGTCVTYRLNGQTRTVTIVGDDEADPNDGRISFSSPLARAMIDAEVGEQLDFGNNGQSVEILAIKAVKES